MQYSKQLINLGTSKWAPSGSLASNATSAIWASMIASYTWALYLIGVGEMAVTDGIPLLITGLLNWVHGNYMGDKTQVLMTLVTTFLLLLSVLWVMWTVYPVQPLVAYAQLPMLLWTFYELILVSATYYNSVFNRSRRWF